MYSMDVLYVLYQRRLQYRDYKSDYSVVPPLSFRHRVYVGPPQTSPALGVCFWHVCVPLLVHRASGHHKRLLRVDGAASAQCAASLRLQGEGPLPAQDHSHGPDCGPGVRALLGAGAGVGPGPSSRRRGPGWQQGQYGGHAFLHRSRLR